MADIFSQQIAEHEAQIAALVAAQKRAQQVTANAKVGDTVSYYHEHYVGRVQEYPALIGALHDDGSADLMVSMENGPVNLNGVRYDPDGKPSSWRPVVPPAL
jgi:hypothetical protein